MLQTFSFNMENNTFLEITLFLSLLSKSVPTSNSLLPCVITPESFQA